MEGVLDDEADQLLRELVEFRRERRDERVEVVALVAAEAARGDHFLDVRVGCVRGEGGAVAEEDREEAAVPGLENCVVQGRASFPGEILESPRVDRGAVFDEQYYYRLGVRIVYAFGETPSSSSRRNASTSPLAAALGTGWYVMIFYARCSRERVCTAGVRASGT